MAIPTDIYKYETHPDWWDKADLFTDTDRLKAQEAYYRIRELYRELPPVPIPPPEPELELGRVGAILCHMVLPHQQFHVKYFGDDPNQRFKLDNCSGKRLLVTISVIEES